MPITLVPPADSQVLLDELRIFFRVRQVCPSETEAATSRLAGIALAAEVERRTEQAVFLHARAQYFARPDGALDASDRSMVEFDQRLYEELEFTGRLRLERTRIGVLPSYVLAAHRDLVSNAHFRFAKVA